MRKSRLLLGCAALPLLAALALGTWVAREYRRDPMPLLDLPAQTRLRETLEGHLLTAAGETRRNLQLTFDGVAEGPLRATLSLPAQSRGRLPVLVVMGGLEAGQDSLRYLERHGPNALLAFEYPRPSQDLYQGRPLFHLPAIRRAVLAAPSQVAALLAWIRLQPWADPDRISLAGYSFGAMFVPATARLAQEQGIALRSLVMAYGGADLPVLLAANAKLRPAWLRPLAARTVGAVVRPLEPALHLPHLRQEALFVTGLRDPMVPLAAARRMQALKPEPRTVLDLDSAHMDPGRPETTRRIVGESWAWLVARGALIE